MRRGGGALIALLAMTGCSFRIATLPEGYRQITSAPPDCETSRAAPVLDALGALVFGTAGGVGLAATVEFCDDADCKLLGTAQSIVALAAAAAFGVASATGFHRTARCRSAHDEARRLRERDAAGERPEPQSPHCAQSWRTIDDERDGATRFAMIRRFIAGMPSGERRGPVAGTLSSPDAARGAGALRAAGGDGLRR